MELQQLGSCLIEADRFRVDQVVICADAKEATSSRQRKSFSLWKRKDRSTVVEPGILLLSSLTGHVASIAWPGLHGQGTVGPTKAEYIKPFSSPVAALSFSPLGQATVQPAAGSSRDLAVANLVVHDTFTIEWDSRQQTEGLVGKDKVKDKTPQRLLLRQLTSGLTIQAAAGQFKWQQLSVADDASAVFAQCPDAVGLPSLWLWTATSSSSDSDGKRPGVWQQLPRIPRLRTTAEGLTDAESAIPLPSVSIHARFLQDSSVRGGLLLAISALVSGSGMGGRAEVFTLQLPVHAGASVAVQHSPFLERWQSCSFIADAGVQPGGSHPEAAFQLAWDHSGAWLAVTACSGSSPAQAWVLIFSADLRSCSKACWASIILGTRDRAAGGAPSVGGAALAQLAWLPGWPLALVMDCQGRCAALGCNAEVQRLRMHAAQSPGGQLFQNAAFESEQEQCLAYNAWRSSSLPVPSACNFALAAFSSQPGLPPVIMLSDGRQVSFWAASIAAELRSRLQANMQQAAAASLTAEVLTLHDNLLAAKPSALSAMSKEDLRKAALELDSDEESVSELSLMTDSGASKEATPESPSAGPAEELLAAADGARETKAGASAEAQLSGMEVAPAGAPDTWLARLSDLSQQYQMQAAMLHLLRCVATAVPSQDARHVAAAHEVACWMGSLMEQHLLACHLASRTGAASAPDEVSMPAPLHGKVPGMQPFLSFSSVRLEEALSQAQLHKLWTPAAAVGLLMYAEDHEAGMNTGLRVWRSLGQHSKSTLLAGACFLACQSNDSKPSISQARQVVDMALAPAVSLPLAQQVDFAVETCATLQQAASLCPQDAQAAGKALSVCAAMQSCSRLLAGMADIAKSLPRLPATQHQAEASLTQQALMLLGKTMRAGLSQCRPHSSIQGQALTGYKHMGQLFGLLWELPGGPARIAALHEGLKDCSIHIHGSCTEELIDRLAADETISQQDYEWLMYGACLPASISMSATDPLAAEVEDLSQQVTLHHATRAVMHLMRPCMSGNVEDQAEAWASQLAGGAEQQLADNSDDYESETQQPWLVLGQLTKHLWHLHCRKQTGIACAVLCSQTSAPIWHPCTVHQASAWAQALASCTSVMAVRTALHAELGGRADRIDMGSDPDAQPSDKDPIVPPVWHQSWESFVGTTKEQLISWARSHKADQAQKPVEPRATSEGHELDAQISLQPTSSLAATISAASPAAAPACWQHPYTLFEGAADGGGIAALGSLLGQHQLPSVSTWQVARLQQLHSYLAKHVQKEREAQQAETAAPAASSSPHPQQHAPTSAFDTAQLTEAAAAALNRGLAMQSPDRQQSVSPGSPLSPRQRDSSKESFDRVMLDAQAAARALKVRVQKQHTSRSLPGSPAADASLFAAGVLPHAALQKLDSGSKRHESARQDGGLPYGDATAIPAVHADGTPKSRLSARGRQAGAGNGGDPALKANIERLNNILKNVAAMKQARAGGVGSPQTGHAIAEGVELPSSSIQAEGMGGIAFMQAAMQAQRQLLEAGPQHAEPELPGWLLAGKGCPCCELGADQISPACAYHAASSHPLCSDSAAAAPAQHFSPAAKDAGYSVTAAGPIAEAQELSTASRSRLSPEPREAVLSSAAHRPPAQLSMSVLPPATSPLAIQSAVVPGSQQQQQRSPAHASMIPAEDSRLPDAVQQYGPDFGMMLGYRPLEKGLTGMTQLQLEDLPAGAWQLMVRQAQRYQQGGSPGTAMSSKHSPEPAPPATKQGTPSPARREHLQRRFPSPSPRPQRPSVSPRRRPRRRIRSCPDLQAAARPVEPASEQQPAYLLKLIGMPHAAAQSRAAGMQHAQQAPGDAQRKYLLRWGSAQAADSAPAALAPLHSPFRPSAALNARSLPRQAPAGRSTPGRGCKCHGDVRKHAAALPDYVLQPSRAVPGHRQAEDARAGAQPMLPGLRLLQARTQAPQHRSGSPPQRQPLHAVQAQAQPDRPRSASLRLLGIGGGQAQHPGPEAAHVPFDWQSPQLSHPPNVPPIALQSTPRDAVHAGKDSAPSMQPGMQLNGSVLRSADLAGNWPGLLEQGPAYVNPLFGVSAWQTPLGRSRLPTEQRGGIVRRSSGPGAPSLRSGPPGEDQVAGGAAPGPQPAVHALPQRFKAQTAEYMMRRMQQDRSPLAPAAEGIPGATLTLPPESEARYPPDSKAVTPKRKLRTSFHHSVDQEKAKRTTDAQTEAEPGTEREGSFNGHILEQVRSLVHDHFDAEATRSAAPDQSGMTSRVEPKGDGGRLRHDAMAHVERVGSQGNGNSSSDSRESAFKRSQSTPIWRP